MRFKCFKHVANIQNTLQMLGPPCNRNALLIPGKKIIRDKYQPLHVVIETQKITQKRHTIDMNTV